MHILWYGLLQIGNVAVELFFGICPEWGKVNAKLVNISKLFWRIAVVVSNILHMYCIQTSWWNRPVFLKELFQTQRWTPWSKRIAVAFSFLWDNVTQSYFYSFCGFQSVKASCKLSTFQKFFGPQEYLTQCLYENFAIIYGTYLSAV